MHWTQLSLISLFAIITPSCAAEHANVTLHVALGTDVTLKCPVDGNEILTTWSGPPSLTAITIPHSAGINPIFPRINYASNYKDLIIKRMTAKYVGVYQCFTPGKTVPGYINLIIKEPSALSPSKSTTTSTQLPDTSAKTTGTIPSTTTTVPSTYNSTLTAFYGENRTLVCPVSGNYTKPSWRGPPGLSVITTTGSNQILTQIPDHIRYEANSQDITVLAVSNQDAGLYSCTVDNYTGYVNLQLKRKPATTTEEMSSTYFPTTTSQSMTTTETITTTTTPVTISMSTTDIPTKISNPTTKNTTITLPTMKTSTPTTTSLPLTMTTTTMFPTFTTTLTKMTIANTTHSTTPVLTTSIVPANVCLMGWEKCPDGSCEPFHFQCGEHAGANINSDLQTTKETDEIRTTQHVFPSARSTLLTTLANLPKTTSESRGNCPVTWTFCPDKKCEPFRWLCTEHSGVSVPPQLIG